MVGGVFHEAQGDTTPSPGEVRDRGVSPFLPSPSISPSYLVLLDGRGSMSHRVFLPSHLVLDAL